MRVHKAALAALVVLVAAPRLAAAHVDDDDLMVSAPGGSSRNVELIGMAGAAFDKAALAASLGARFRLADAWHLGLHAEFNPYASVTTHKLRAGSANFFASGDYRWAQIGRVGLTTIAYAGMSWLLFDLYGVPKGSVGPYFALTPVAVEVRLGGRSTLIIESTRLAVPLPQLSGVPFGYRQYRFSLGIAIALD